MNQQKLLFRISQLLSRFTEQVKILNSNGEFSINIHAENILINILNIIYDCNLKNINYEEGKTYPSIDLRDYDKRLAIQVTSTSNLDKIKNTLSGFISNNLYKKFDTLYVYIITEKQKKYKQNSIDEIIENKIRFTTECIIDKTDLYKILNAQNDIQKITNVCKLLETQFADNKKEVSIRPTTGIKPLYTTIATVTMNLIVSAAIVLLNPYVTVYISYKIPPFALSVHIPDVSTSIYVEVDSKVLLGLPSCDKAFVR